MEEMKKQGYGGFFMHSRVGLVTEYLSDRWMQLIGACVEKAQELGMEAWLYDEDKWPSGYAGGIVPRQNHAFVEKGVVFVGAGDLRESDTVLQEVRGSGETRYIALRYTEMGNPWFNLTTYIDTMNPEAVRAFLDSTHERYAATFGKYLSSGIRGIFTDEPCYGMYCFYTVPFVPWSEHLPEVFEREKGYSITGRLAELFVDTGNYEKTRFDFYDCISRLFLESYTVQYARWCEEHGLCYTGHYMSEDNLIDQICWLGSVMPHYEYMGLPGVDKLFRNLDQTVTLRQLTSVAEQLGKDALSECFAGIGHDSGFFKRKWIADWQAVNGINIINSHLSHYSMRGERKRDYPPNLFYQQPWWDDERPFADYLANLCSIAARGKRSVRVLVLHTISSAWCLFNPTQKEAGYPEIQERFNRPFLELADALSMNRIDFHFGDETILARHARVEDGKIIVGAYSSDTVVLPP